MGAVGGVAILGGNFEAPQFPEDKFIQRSITAGTQESSPIDAVILDAPALGAPGQLDSHSMLWKGHSNDGSPHTIDWKLFVDVTADDGTGSLWTLQTRIDAASYATVMTIDDAGLLTVSGATFTMDQLIIDSDNAEAVLIRKDGDAGDVFIVDTINDVVRMGSDATTLTFGASSDTQLKWVGAGILALDDDVTEPWFQVVSGSDNTIGGLKWLINDRFQVGTFAASPRNVQFTRGDQVIAELTNTQFIIGTPVTTAIPLVFPHGTTSDEIIIMDSVALTTDGQRDSHAILWTGKGFESATPHDIDWKMFVDVTADDGTGSIFTWQTRIDAASYTTVFQLDDAGNLTIPGSFTVDGLIIDVTSTEAFLVRKDGDTEDIFIVDTTNEAVRLRSDDTFLAWGAASDAQMHRGDGADIIEQRRGANPQEWRLYDRFVSHSDYDRLTVYIGGGPPLKTIEFEAESTNPSQGISLQLEAKPGGSSDGRLTLLNGTTQFQLTPSSGTFNAPLAITSPGTNSLTLNAFLSSLGAGTGTSGIGIKMDIAGQGSSDFEDSHKFDMIGAGENANRATWRTFVDVIDVDANSIWTLQDDKNGGGFVTNFSITDDGGFNFPQPLPSHAIGAAIDLSSQLTLSGDYFSLLSGGTTASRFKTEDRITGATGQTVGLFQAWFGGNIRTQTATESVSNIATVVIDEPNITDNLTGSITNASSLLITGAPTEGVSNYALRIVAGDVVIDDAAAFLFNFGGSTNLSALSVAPTGRLEVGLSSDPWARITLYAPIVNAVGGILRVEASAANHSAQTDMQTTFADVATSAGSSVTAAGLIPGGSFVIGVTVRVLTTVTGPTGFDVGDGIDVDRWGNSIPVAAGQTTNITSFTSGAVTTFQTANDVVITSDGVDFTGGSIRITVHYTTLRTSDA